MPTAGMSPVFIPPLLSGMSARAPIMLNKKADYTVLASDSGTIFHTTGATANVNFTLPAISSGPFWFKFICGAGYTLTVTAQTADTIVTMNDLAADSVAFSTASELIGGLIEVYCDGTTLFVLARPATTLQHVTIAT